MNHPMRWIELTEVTFGNPREQKIVVATAKINSLKTIYVDATYTDSTQVSMDGDCILVKEGIETIMDLVAGLDGILRS